MRLPGRLTAAMEVLADLDQRKRPASEALRDWGLSHRFAGSGDRAAIGNLVYDALRKRASHAFAMGADTPRALVLSVAVRDWGEPLDTLIQDFKTDRFAPESISEVEAASLSKDSGFSDAPDAVRANMPDWLAPAFETAFGADWVRQAQGLTTRPPVDLRVNTLKSDAERIVKSLRRFAPVAGPVEGSLRLAAGPRDARTPNVLSDEAYQKGWFEVQDAGSQMVAKLAGALPGDQVLDLCAGAGGKSLAMAALMLNSGQIFAYDSDRSRLAPIYDRIKRAGAHNIQTRAPEPGVLDDLAGKMDRVIVDAPCTGTGTWRRRPDAKWRLSEDQLQARCAEQATILQEAARYVKPGGHLAYITCSLLPRENADQVGRFMAAHPEFTPVDGTQLLAENLPDLPQTHALPAGAGLMLTPATTATDGFFIAVLTKR